MTEKNISFDLGEMMGISSSTKPISVCLSEVGINSILDLKEFAYKIINEKRSFEDAMELNRLFGNLKEIFPELNR